jgi:hypothetical protein
MNEPKMPSLSESMPENFSRVDGSYRPSLSDDSQALLECITDTLKSGTIDTCEVWQHTGAGDLRIRELKLETFEPHELAAKITRVIDGTRRGFLRHHTYQVRFLGAGKVMGAHTIAHNPEIARAPSENASLEMLLAHFMRHNEGLVRALHTGYALTYNQLLLMLKEALTRLRFLETREHDVSEAYARLKLQEADIEGVKERAKIRGHAERQLLEQAVKAAPHVLTAALEKWTGKPLLPPALRALRNFAESIKPDQMAKIYEIFDDKQREQFGTILGANDLEPTLQEVADKTT